jgi:hypothetical protein
MNYNFAELVGLIDPAFRLAYGLAGFVQTHPEQVTACCALYLAGARFLTVARRRRI